MSELHKSPDDASLPLEFSEGQRGLLCNNLAPSRCPSLGSSRLPSETLQSLDSLGYVLRPTYKRMQAAGYTIKDGVIIKNHDK